MPKFRVTVTYLIRTTEVYEVEVDSEDLEEFKDSPYDFCDSEENKIEEYTGDIRGDSWEETVEEISVLDQIVEAVAESE